jgi:hypothetical protein
VHMHAHDATRALHAPVLLCPPSRTLALLSLLLDCNQTEQAGRGAAGAHCAAHARRVLPGHPPQRAAALAARVEPAHPGLRAAALHLRHPARPVVGAHARAPGGGPLAPADAGSSIRAAGRWARRAGRVRAAHCVLLVAWLVTLPGACVRRTACSSLRGWSPCVRA